MTLERSHGKLRPGLTRSSDLPDVEAARKPSDGRGPDGRFAAGNRCGIDARAKHAIAKALGTRSGDPTAMLVARDAQKVFGATLRTLPSDAAPVRSLVALHARHVAMAAFYASRAEASGLATDDGMKFDDAASKHSQRAERVLVTAIDVASRLAKVEREAQPLNAPWLAPVDGGSK